MWQLHNRIATTLAAIIADVDAEIARVENVGDASPAPKAILICSHAAPLIAIGRALTGTIPDDINAEDFKVFTAGLSIFVRRNPPTSTVRATRVADPSLNSNPNDVLAQGTRISPASRITTVPDWKNGKGVGGGWNCVMNGDCSFLSGGAERGWYSPLLISVSLYFPHYIGSCL
jgi:transcription factor C subunit 7